MLINDVFIEAAPLKPLNRSVTSLQWRANRTRSIQGRPICFSEESYLS